jgi:hypothetical protein
LAHGDDASIEDEANRKDQVEETPRLLESDKLNLQFFKTHAKLLEFLAKFCLFKNNQIFSQIIIFFMFLIHLLFFCPFPLFSVAKLESLKLQI